MPAVQGNFRACPLLPLGQRLDEAVAALRLSFDPPLTESYRKYSETPAACAQVASVGKHGAIEPIPVPTTEEALPVNRLR